jgi:hypothetical protein
MAYQTPEKFTVATDLFLQNHLAMRLLPNGCRKSQIRIFVIPPVSAHMD